jgi:hypothetical protein
MKSAVYPLFVLQRWLIVAEHVISHPALCASIINHFICQILTLAHILHETNLSETDMLLLKLTALRTTAVGQMDPADHPPQSPCLSLKETRRHKCSVFGVSNCTFLNSGCISDLCFIY